jgi:hypothetical protein
LSRGRRDRTSVVEARKLDPVPRIMLKYIKTLTLEEIPMNVRKMVHLGILLAVIPALSGCWYAAAAGAGAYGGYKMKEKGYTVQSPVTKEKSDKGEETEQSK